MLKNKKNVVKLTTVNQCNRVVFAPFTLSDVVLPALHTNYEA